MISNRAIIILVLCLSLFDLFMTWNMLHTFETKFPDKDVTVLEQNPIIRFFTLKFGVTNGMLLVAPLILGLWYIIIRRTVYEFKFFALGVLTMMGVFHLLNWLQLRSLT